MTIDQQTLEDVVGHVATDMAAAAAVTSIQLGDRLGLYRALAEGGPADAAELARRTGTNARLVQEWLDGQAVAGYLTRDPEGSFRLSPEQAMVLADDDSPAFLAGFATVLAINTIDADRIDAAFRSDGALAWGNHHPSLFPATDRFFRPGYRAALTEAWLPALDGVVERLRSGARVADVGCGFGTSIVTMAEAFPDATFVGVDPHQGSLDALQKKAADAGVADRVEAVRAGADAYIGGPYDLICFFDSLHDMGDPGSAIANARRQLAPDGTVLLVEPMAHASVDDAIGDPVAKLFFAVSSTMCVPNALADSTHALGNQVPDATWRELFLANGFSRFRRAAETPFNRILEARP